MKLIIQIQLLPDAIQKKLLLETMRQFNAAASFAARVGFRDRVFSRPPIHKRCYYDLREKFRLSSQMAVRAIGKAVEFFSRGKARCPKFKATGAMTYDERIASFKGIDRVSLLTLGGRQIIPMIYGEYQKAQLSRLKGQMDLVYRDRKFYLLATVDLPDTAPIEVKEFLGVDLGIVQIASDSDGGSFSGDKVEKVRRRFHENRKRLQSKRTRGTTKILRRISRRESNFRRHENHVISKTIVAKAKGTSRGIALEDLKGIRERITVRKKQRAKQSGWSFGQLRAFIEYKAKLAGVPVVILDPRNSSRTCSRCNHCSKGNRKSQSEFSCEVCHFEINADFNAARNLRDWAASKPASELSNHSKAVLV